MSMLDRVPAVRRIDTNRSDLFAFELVGEMTAADVENLYGLLEAAYALHPEIDLLARLVTLESIDWPDVSRDTLSESRSEARAHVRRCAVIGGSGLGAIDSLLSVARGGEIRRFDTEAEAEAWAWLDAQPAS
jgi:hypothetical protein